MNAGGGHTLVIAGPGLLQVHPLPACGEIVIGRDPNCDVTIDDERISRRHARLRFDTTCALEDLGSRNGTTVRGDVVRTGEVRTIVVGEGFGIGPFALMLVAEKPTSTAAPCSLAFDDPAPAHPPILMRSIAANPLPVLIRGESGVGKEVLARTLHRLSGRPGQFVALNCATFGRELFESELFGHERGAFTGAVAAKPGLLEVAARGTVLLDEIAELPAALQSKLLRVIETQEVLRVGGTQPVPIDVRFVAATHCELSGAISRGTFRLDLYYRLAVLTLTISPLRERAGRIAVLARELAGHAAARCRRAAPRLAPAAIAVLQGHAWPGNVRELRNVIERAVLLAGEGNAIEPQHIVFDAPVASGTQPPPYPVDDEERARIVEALEACAGNQTQAAKQLGVSRATLAHKLDVHRLPRPRKR